MQKSEVGAKRRKPSGHTWTKVKPKTAPSSGHAYLAWAQIKEHSKILQYLRD